MGQHGFATTGGTHEEDVVAAGGSDLQGALGQGLAPDLLQGSLGGNAAGYRRYRRRPRPRGQTGLCQTGLCQTGLCQTGLCRTGLCRPGLCRTGLCRPGLCRPRPQHRGRRSGLLRAAFHNKFHHIAQGIKRIRFDTRAPQRLG